MDLVSSTNTPAVSYFKSAHIMAVQVYRVVIPARTLYTTEDDDDEDSDNSSAASAESLEYVTFTVRR